MKCPLSNIPVIGKCPVTTCMWNTENTKTGCFHGIPNLSQDEIAELKGVKASAIDKVTDDVLQKVKSHIIESKET